MITATTTFETYQTDDVTVIQFSVAEISHLNHQHVAAELLEIIKPDCPSKLLFDLKRIHHLPHPGLILLVMLNRIVRANGCRLRLCNLLPQVQQALERKCLNRVFAIFDDVLLALHDF